jgi:ABC-2 type transport system ATP-binding protein
MTEISGARRAASARGPGRGAATLAVETVGLRKVRRSWLGRATVLIHDVDLQVPAGTVHALLGPEGAGKTAVLRMLLGLTRPSRGAVRLLGEPVRRGRAARLETGRVGAVLGEPGFLPHLSGHRNLLLLARQAGIDTGQVDVVLGRVGLTRRARSRYRTYSADARRRLALAAALMSSPELLVLDEPTRGLEAPAARAVRDLVRELAHGGVTVLVTSHDVGEVQQMCDSVSVLVEGRLVAQGPVSDLVGDKALGAVRVRVSDPLAATTALEQAGYRVAPDGEVLHVEDVSRPDDVLRTLVGLGVWPRELTPDRVDLETVVARVAWDRTLRVGGARRAAPRRLARKARA